MIVGSPPPESSQDVRPCQSCGKYISTLATLCKHCWSENRPVKEVTAERDRRSFQRRASAVMLVASVAVLLLSLGYRFFLASTVQGERALALSGTHHTVTAPKKVKTVVSRNGPIDPSQRALTDEVDDGSFASTGSQYQTCYITIALSAFSLMCSGFAFMKSWG